MDLLVLSECRYGNSTGSCGLLPPCGATFSEDGVGWANSHSTASGKNTSHEKACALFKLIGLGFPEGKRVALSRQRIVRLVYDMKGK